MTQARIYICLIIDILTEYGSPKLIFAINIPARLLSEVLAYMYSSHDTYVVEFRRDACRDCGGNII